MHYLFVAKQTCNWSIPQTFPYAKWASKTKVSILKLLVTISYMVLVCSMAVFLKRTLKHRNIARAYNGVIHNTNTPVTRAVPWAIEIMSGMAIALLREVLNLEHPQICVGTIGKAELREVNDASTDAIISSIDTWKFKNFVYTNDLRCANKSLNAKEAWYCDGFTVCTLSVLFNNLLTLWTVHPVHKTSQTFPK